MLITLQQRLKLVLKFHSCAFYLHSKKFNWVPRVRLFLLTFVYHFQKHFNIYGCINEKTPLGIIYFVWKGILRSSNKNDYLISITIIICVSLGIICLFLAETTNNNTNIIINIYFVHQLTSIYDFPSFSIRALLRDRIKMYYKSTNHLKNKKSSLFLGVQHDKSTISTHTHKY